MKTIFPLFLLLICRIAFAQDSTEVEKTPSWEKTLSIGLNLSHTLNANAPTSAPKQGFSTTNAVDIDFNYVKEESRLEFKNELHWTFSFFKSNTKTPSQNTTDALTSFHNLSYSLRKNGRWNANIIVTTETPIFKQYEGNFLKDYDQLGQIQRFLNPYEYKLSPGLKYQYNKYFGISISPYAVKFFGLTDQFIADKGAFIEEQKPDGHYKTKISERLGAEVIFKYKRVYKKKVDMNYTLTASSSYFEKILKNGHLSGIFLTKFTLFKGFSISHRAKLDGNLAQKPFKPYYNQVILLAYTLAL